MREEGVQIPVGGELPAKLLLLVLLVIVETLYYRIQQGIHHTVVAGRVFALGPVPDLRKGIHIGRCKNGPFQQLVLQLGKAVWVGILTYRRCLVVGLERLVDIVFFVGEIQHVCNSG